MGIIEFSSWEEILDIAEKFFKKLKKKDSICLMHHGDADGCTSGCFIYNTIKEITGKHPDNLIWVSTKSYDLKNERELIRSIRPTVLMVTDLDIIRETEIIGEWSIDIERIFIYDHHEVKLSSSVIPNNVTYLNARLLNMPGIWHPASYFGYCLYNRFSTIDYTWVTALGLRGDHALEEYPDLIEKVKISNKHMFDPIEGEEYKNLLERIVFLINAGFFYNPDLRSNISFKVLQTAFEKNDPFLFLDQKNIEVIDLLKKHQEIVTYVADTIEKVKNDVEISDRTFFPLEVNTPHYIVGIIAGKLSKLFPDKIFAVGSTHGPEMGVEIRMGKNLNVNLVSIIDIMRETFEFISAGGHPRAAGCLIKTEKFAEFTDKFSDNL